MGGFLRLILQLFLLVVADRLLLLLRWWLLVKENGCHLLLYRWLLLSQGYLLLLNVNFLTVLGLDIRLAELFAARHARR